MLTHTLPGLTIGSLMKVITISERKCMMFRQLRQIWKIIFGRLPFLSGRRLPRVLI